MITIHCCDCFAPREIKPQDAFQVKRCVPCQKKHVAARRKWNAQWKREDNRENIARLDRIAATLKDTGKITWEDYCYVKWGVSDLSEAQAIRAYGRGDCAASGEHRYDEADRQYDIEYNGFTEQDIEDKLVLRGAEALIDNEMDTCGDVNAGKDDMKYWFEWAYDRYKK